MKATITIVVTFEDLPEESTADGRTLKVSIDGHVEADEGMQGPRLGALCERLIDSTSIMTRMELGGPEAAIDALKAMLEPPPVEH